MKGLVLKMRHVEYMCIVLKDFNMKLAKINVKSQKIFIKELNLIVQMRLIMQDYNGEKANVITNI